MSLSGREARKVKDGGVRGGKGRCEGEAQEKLGEPVVSNIGQV